MSSKSANRFSVTESVIFSVQYQMTHSILFGEIEEGVSSNICTRLWISQSALRHNDSARLFLFKKDYYLNGTL